MRSHCKEQKNKPGRITRSIRVILPVQFIACYLCRRLSILFCQFFDHFIAEMLGSVAPAPERIPGFNHDAVLTYIFLQLCVLIVQMVFILDHGRNDRCEGSF